MKGVTGLLVLIAVFAFVRAAHGASLPYEIFNSEDQRRAAGEMLVRYQLQHVDQAYDQRERAIRNLQSAEDVRAWATRARETFLESIGGLSTEKSPLEARVVGRLDRGSWVIERILFQSRPNFWVSANLYLPNPLPSAKIPGVLAPMGHTAEGKSAGWLQQRVVGLVRQGYAVLTYDQIGLGERWQHWDPDTGLSPAGHRTAEGTFSPQTYRAPVAHSYAGNPLWLTGDSLMQHVVWDGMRAFDYLASRDEVDPERIAVSGASMGGLASMLLSAAEPRLHAAIPVSHVTQRRLLAHSLMARDAEQIQLGVWKQGWDHADLLLAMALHGGHVLLGANTDDFFPIEGARQAADELTRFFSLLGMEERFQFFVSDYGHGWSIPMYYATYQFLHQAFGLPGSFSHHSETGIVERRDWSKLWASEAGQVIAPPLNSETVLSLNAKKALELRETRRASISPAGVIASAVSLSDTRDLGQPMIERRERFERDGMDIQGLILTVEPGIHLPALWIAPKSGDPNRIAFVFSSPLGKHSVFDEEHFPLTRVLQSGSSVLAIDVRGWGETRWRRNPNQSPTHYLQYTAPTPWAEEHILTYNALRLGSTLIGQRASDLLSAARWVREGGAPSPGDRPLVYIWGEGELGIAAVHAVAASDDQALEAVALNSLFSYDNWAQTPLYDVPVAMIIPNILQEYDLPELSWALAERAGRPVVTWVDPIDAQGNSISASILYEFVSKSIGASVNHSILALKVASRTSPGFQRNLTHLTRAQEWTLDLEKAR